MVNGEWEVKIDGRLIGFIHLEDWKYEFSSLEYDSFVVDDDETLVEAISACYGVQVEDLEINW